MSLPIADLSPLPSLLAQNPADSSVSILQWLGVILALTIVIVAVALWLRRRLLAEDEEVLPESPGFTLGDLRDMHKAGKLTDEEFATAKAGLIARSRAMLHADEEPASQFPTDITPVETGDPADDNDADDDADDRGSASDKR